tara:strand:- start:1 stop:597 length:597 start_codon:yes stop_codon:yes gene_type:complete
MKHLVIILALLIAVSSPVSAQSIDKGHAFAKADDYAAALKEWKPLAEQGNAEAQYLLGFLFQHGLGVASYNDKEAAKWYGLAAEQGHSKSQFELAEAYHWGTGVIQNYAEAVKWHYQSAKQGSIVSQDRLGYVYWKHFDSPKSNLLAHMWYNIAAANGMLDSGRLREQIASSMTSVDISKAQAMASECMNSGYQKCGY